MKIEILVVGLLLLCGSAKAAVNVQPNGTGGSGGTISLTNGASIGGAGFTIITNGATLLNVTGSRAAEFDAGNNLTNAPVPLTSACASLPTAGVPAGRVTYCSDCLTPIGVGERVEFDGTNWWIKTGFNNILATTTNEVFVLSCVTNAVTVSTPKVDIVCSPSGSGLISMLVNGITATLVNSGSATFNQASTNGPQWIYGTGGNAQGGGRSAGMAQFAQSTGDYYAMGGQFAVSGFADGTDGFINVIGISGTQTTNLPINGSFFLQDKNGHTGHGQTYTNDWIAVRVSGSSYNYADTGLAVRASATGMDKLAVIQTTTATKFYTNGVLACTITSAAPSGNLYGYFIETLNDNGTVTKNLYSYVPWAAVIRATPHSY